MEKVEKWKGRRMKWIPRTEREPDTGGHILITVLWEKGVDTAFDNDYEVMEEDWRVGEYEIKEGTATPLVKRIHERMIAWMPMPKPYRKKEDEYVILHHEDIHFIDEDAERAFYEALTERRNDETD